jgi:hypothetical protein
MIAGDTDLDALFNQLHLANARRAWRGLIDRAERARWNAAGDRRDRPHPADAPGAVDASAQFPFLKTIDDFSFTYQSSLRLQMLGSRLQCRGGAAVRAPAQLGRCSRPVRDNLQET